MAARNAFTSACEGVKGAVLDLSTIEALCQHLGLSLTEDERAENGPEDSGVFDREQVHT